MLRCVIWDFNGTLLDDVETGLATFNDALAHYGLPLTDLREYRENIDMPVEKYYAMHFDLSQIPMAALQQSYLDSFERHSDLLKLGKGALRAVTALKERGVRQCVISAYKQDSIERLLKRFGIFEYMDGICGADEDGCTSKVERGSRWILEHGIDPAAAIAVGDMIHDHELAQAIGTRCLLFSGGHCSRERLLRVGVPVIDDLTEVLNYE